MRLRKSDERLNDEVLLGELRSLRATVGFTLDDAVLGEDAEIAAHPPFVSLQPASEGARTVWSAAPVL